MCRSCVVSEVSELGFSVGIEDRRYAEEHLRQSLALGGSQIHPLTRVRLVFVLSAAFDIQAAKACHPRLNRRAVVEAVRVVVLQNAVPG